MQLLAYLTANDDTIRPPALPIGAMHAGGNEATPLKLNKVARKEVEQTVACEEDDAVGIEDGDGDDSHEYETNEDGTGPMDAGGKNNSRSHDKHPEADAGTRKLAREDDDNGAIDDGQGDDYQEYDSSEGGRGHMDASGKKNSRVRAKHREADAGTRKRAREDDDHGAIDDGQSDDYQEYDSSEGGRGHMDAGGKKNSRVRDKHREAEAVSATNKTRPTSKVQMRLHKVQRMNKRAKKELIASVVAQVLAAQKAKKKSRQGRNNNGKRAADDAWNEGSNWDEASTWEKPPPPAPKKVRITTESIPNNRLRNWTVAMRRNFKPNTITEVMRPWELSRERFDEVTPCLLHLPSNILCITPRAASTQRRTKHLRSTASALLPISLRNTPRLKPRLEKLKLWCRLFSDARKSKLRTLR